LIGREVVPIEDEPGMPAFMEWALWFEKARDLRIIRQSEVGPIWISTVFLGLDHNYSDDGPPHLFETMAFGPPDHLIEFRDHKRLTREELGWQTRCGTYDEAEKMHAEAIAWAEERLAEIDKQLAWEKPA
jgi:hypothetical protein